MRLPDEFSFSCPLKINCGSRALAHLPAELSAVNAHAPLIVASRDQVGKKKIRRVVDAFRTSGLTLGIYDRLPDQLEPDLMHVLARMYREGGCDSVIAVGHGPVVDAAKVLNVFVSSGDHGEVGDAFGKMTDPGPLRPLILVATSGGNGDEVTGYASDGVRRLRSLRLVPTAAFIDPSMMDDGDLQAVVDGALIALAHAVEAFLDHRAGPMCRAYAHTAIGLLVKYLPRVIRKTDRRKSLCAVVNGQVAAGCAFFASSPGICHTLAVELNGATTFPLGFLMAMLLPHRVAEAVTIQPDQVGELLYPMAGPEFFALTAADLKTHRCIALFWELYDALNAQLSLNIPMSLGDTGLTDEQIKDAQSRVMHSNPEAAHLARIISRAAEGATMMAG